MRDAQRNAALHMVFQLLRAHEILRGPDEARTLESLRLSLQSELSKFHPDQPRALAIAQAYVEALESDQQAVAELVDDAIARWRAPKVT